ncbi:proteasome maturation protein [Ischnura elegans]|uniref:proteasome maturation protein n=1 Tax=Ischnura elegans TaxID=197161 RepID=UPI001ED8ADB4|nr:proteasome maturation protein [Ischnura elegans]
MNVGFNSARPKAGNAGHPFGKDDNYGVENIMTYGLAAARPPAKPCHPLEVSEKTYLARKEVIDFNILRNTQGLHAPLRLQMERKAVSRVGRLPFLPSSRPSLDVLLGRDEEIGFEDILNTCEFREVAGQPHAVVEKQMGIL